MTPPNPFRAPVAEGGPAGEPSNLRWLNVSSLLALAFEVWFGWGFEHSSLGTSTLFAMWAIATPFAIIWTVGVVRGRLPARLAQWRAAGWAFAGGIAFVAGAVRFAPWVTRNQLGTVGALVVIVLCALTIPALAAGLFTRLAGTIIELAQSQTDDDDDHDARSTDAEARDEG